MTDDIRVTHAVHIPRSAIKLRFARSSGPGGQNVNKVSSKVEVIFDPRELSGVSDVLQQRIQVAIGDRLDSRGLLHVVADESRSQWANRELAITKLVGLLREAIRERKRRRPTAPTLSSREHRAFLKVRRSQVKKLRGRVSGDE